VPTGAANVFCVENPGDLDPLEIATLFNGAGTANLWSSMSNQVTSSELLVKNGPDENGPTAELTGGVQGHATGACGAAAPAFLVTKNTALGGRKGKGRFFIPAVPEPSVDVGGILTTSVWGAMQTDADDFFAQMNDAFIPLALEHGDGSTPTPLTGLSVSTIVATQRRRQRR